MSTIKDKLIKELVTDLTDKDMEKLITVVQAKIDKGQSVTEIGIQLVTATAETIYYAFPDMDHDEIIQLAEEVSDVLVDKIINYVDSVKLKEENIPHGQLN